MSFANPEQIEGALQRLGTRMAYEYADPIALVICGGSALNVLNIARRTTRDVDVLAVVEESDEGLVLRPDRELPDSFRQIVADVGRDLDLAEDWLNMGPGDVLAVYGPPDGMTRRWERRDYGPCLTAYFVGRRDQVHFKLLAAADPRAQPRHFEDLALRIRPTEEDLRASVGWLLGRATSPWFREQVRRVLEALGYDHIADEIPE